jgi:type II restriction/modification system DNA methylase subunit YeeA
MFIAPSQLGEGKISVSPEEFVRKWSAAELGERAAAQSHFIDLCHVLDEQAPTDADPAGEWYAFERGASKTTGARGWADVWKRDHFGWEYKRKGRDLDAAFVQLQQYALALENPPLLVVCGLDQFRIHTNWTNSVSERHDFALGDLREPAVRRKLKWVFSDPERLKPGKTRHTLTQEAAAEFAKLAHRLRERGHPSEAVAHFINRLVFCMFAEDVDLLPGKMFKRMLEHAYARPDEFATLARDLFRVMKDGGKIGFERVEWFNGGLFDDDTAFALEKTEIAIALKAAGMDWGEIDPSIFGTLFVRGLDPDKRSQLGAQYTDREKIMQIVRPVLTEPWAETWRTAKVAIEASLEAARKSNKPRERTKAREYAERRLAAFLDELRSFRVFDPACGSGNFLYLALLELKDLEHRASIEAELLGLPRGFPVIGPASVKGIEVNGYAADLARITIWIGEIQWMRRNGFDVSRNPILKPLENIEHRDALLNEDGTEATWPDADVVIGNPPFLGNKSMIKRLGLPYVANLRGAFSDRLGGGVDLVAYWFEKARALIETGKLKRAGLVATQSIRRGGNGSVLDRIASTTTIFNAWSDEPWVVDGADVRVSVISFGGSAPGVELRLDGKPCVKIHADLTGGDLDLSIARPLLENAGVSFQGTTKAGAFDVTGEQARDWLRLPANPNGRRNTDVVRPWLNGADVTGRPADRWIIDYGVEMTEREAEFYEAPFAHILAHVKAERLKVRRETYRTYWWRHAEPRPGLRKALKGLARFIVTPRVAKHRIFTWVDAGVVPDTRLVVVARDDDTTFGILQSRFHQIWSLRLGGRHGVGNDPQYTPSQGFETFPFPTHMTPNVPAAQYGRDGRAKAIAAAARHLYELRRAWLNPPELVKRLREVASGLPDRIVPKDAHAKIELEKLTLTNLYNKPPQWLVRAHRDLDAAVAAAYGWPADITDDTALTNLLQLNRTRAVAQEALPSKRKGKGQTPDDLRREPQMPLPIPGGRGKPRQPDLPLDEPLLVPSRRTSRSRKRAG